MNAFLDSLRALVGAPYVLTDHLEPYVNDWRKKYFGKALAVVKPGSTDEVAQVVKLCAAYGVPIVPQAGNTGLVGGGVPDTSGTALILNVSRLNRVREVDLINNTMTVEAGCILQSLQDVAEENGRLFPLSLASEGSCEIGGNLSTNAGGVQVLRYGNTRDLCLGLEVVLASGEVWHGLRGLRKDNTGYDLKQLFIGAEGTLGIITAATLTLLPKPTAVHTSMVALASPTAALQLLTHMKAHLGDRLTAFELLSDFALSLVEKHLASHRSPFAARHAWQVLMEVADSGSQASLTAQVEAALGAALEVDLAQDAALAQSENEAKKLWALRENITEAQVHEGRNIKHDISLPISQIAAFIDLADAALAARYPGVRPVNFGHVGDGNLHYNIAHPLTTFTEESWMHEWETVNTIVHDAVKQFNGSISAEHGLGQLKREEIKRYKAPLELDLMRAIKHALDPKGLMNPGKVI